MKYVKLFETFTESVLENERADLSQKINDTREKLADLQRSLSEMGNDEDPNPIKMAITQLKIQKQNLKSQMLQLDMKILSFKEKLD